MNIFSDYSLWWLLPIVLVSATISYIYYFKTEQSLRFDKKQRKLLLTLRATSLILCFFLILGFVWESKSFRIEKPLIVSIYDNSESVLNYSDSSQVKNQMDDFHKQLKTKLGDAYDFLDLTVGERVENFKSLTFKDKVSDLSAGFKYVQDSYFNRNIGAVILLSDGNFNQGVHPMYEAERIELTPVFSLLVGDTITKKDIVVRSINANDFAFVGNIVPIQALIDFQFIKAGNYEVQLLQDGKKVQSKFLKHGGEQFSQKEITFELEAKTNGFHQLSVYVLPVNGEYTTSNNFQKCMIEVVDSKRDVLFLASAPHPDIAALKTVFQLDKEAKIKAHLTTNYQLKGETPDFVVWYENGLRPNASLFTQLRDKNIPVLLILGPSVTTSLLKNYGLTISTPNNNQSEEVYPSLAQQISVFGLSETVVNTMKNYAPLQTKYGAYKLPVNSLILVKQRVGSISTNNPLIAVVESNKAKLGLILGEGIWRWRLKEFVKSKKTDGFDEFFQKFTQYIAIRQNREPLRVKFPNKLNAIEDVIVNAEFYNESMELITTPEIKLELTRDGGKTITQHFSVVDNFYQLNAGVIAPGKYKWKVIADTKTKKYMKSGSFALDAISLEKQESQASYNTLNQLAVQSDGKVFFLKDYVKLIDELKKADEIAPVSYQESSYKNLIDWKWYFAFLFLCIASEWFLRRWWGSY